MGQQEQQCLQQPLLQAMSEGIDEVARLGG